MSTPFSFIGAADAYLDVLTDTGVRTGLELKGNCTNFTPKPDSERKEQTANGRDNFGQVLASATLPKPMTAKITFNQLDAELFAAAFFGTNTALTQAAGSISATDVVVIHDKWVDTGVLMLNEPVFKDATDTTTYTEGTHYILNKRLGMIKALSTGTIVDGATLHMTGTKSAITAGSIMAAMTKANVRVRIKLDGQNFADGRNFIADVFQMRLAPSTEFSFVSNDFVDVTFEGSLETPTGFTEPMQLIWLS